MVDGSNPTTFCNLDLTDPNAEYEIPNGLTVNCRLTLSPDPNIRPPGGSTSLLVLGPGATCVINEPTPVPCPANINGVEIRQNSSPTAIPTLSQYGLIALSLLLGGLAARRGRSRLISQTHSSSGQQSS